jgi:hypothetical protein
MNFADSVIDNLFKSSQAPNEPLIVETLERSRSDKKLFQHWLIENNHRKLNRTFAWAYFLRNKQIACSVNIHIFNSKAANAFSLSCNECVDPKSFQHYFDYLKYAVLGLGYELQHSEREITDRSFYIETVDRHYLKFPQKQDSEVRNSQLYGNVMIEHVAIDNKPSYIKFMVRYKNEEEFGEPLSFHDLVCRLFGVEF